MIYVYAGILIIVFGAGFATSNKISSAEIKQLELSISEANAKAIAISSESEKQLADAKLQAVKFNQELEKAHEQSINTTNHLVDKLYAASRKSCENSVSTTGSAGIFEEKTADDPRIGRFAELARQSAIYAESCWKYVDNKCGIKKSE